MRLTYTPSQPMLWQVHLSDRRSALKSHAAQIVAAWTKIPVEKMSVSNMAHLRQLASHLNSRIIGQRNAVSTVARALQRARCGLKDPARPIATLLFAGPTGVGKTCLTNELADYIFDSRVRSRTPPFCSPTAILPVRAHVLAHACVAQTCAQTPLRLAHARAHTSRLPHRCGKLASDSSFGV